MGLREDLGRFKDVGEENRMDLREFIEHGQLGEDIQIPIKIVDLPEFVYEPKEKGGIGQAEEDEDPRIGDPIRSPQEEDDEVNGEAGEGSGDHGYYEMDPEEFAEELDDELGLDLEPKGKKVVEETVGDRVDVSRAGPRSALDVEYLYKEGLKRKLAMWFDEGFLREACKVSGWGARDVYDYARTEYSMPVSMKAVEEILDDVNGNKYNSVDELEERMDVPRRNPTVGDIKEVLVRRDDERYRHPEVIKRKEKNVVVINIRDVSGSMRREKRELVERVFTPLDWYLQGKYEHAEFRYIAHDAEAWEVERVNFFGMKSGGGTKISSAYETALEILETYYPWTDWNRYVFGAGDGENWGSDTRDNLIPLIEEIDANLHGCVEVKGRGKLVEQIDTLTDDSDVVTVSVDSRNDVIPAIKRILSTSSDRPRD